MKTPKTLTGITDKKEYEANLIENILDSILKNGGAACLSSVILTGSFGRGEPTYQLDGETFLLKSDVEIALIFNGRRSKAFVKAFICKAAGEFAEDLNLMPVSRRRIRWIHNFNYTLITPRHKTLFTYDLYNGSRTVWGKDYIGGRRVTLKELDLFETKRIVANRIGEFIYLSGQQNTDEYLRMQWKGKILLAIGTAWLVLRGKYASSYNAQKNEVLMNQTEAAALFGDCFPADYYSAFYFLREGGDAYSIPDERLRYYVAVVSALFSAHKIKKCKAGSLSRFVKRLLKNMRSGMKFGLYRFENRILQGLIDSFITGSDVIAQYADAWRKVLY